MAYAKEYGFFDADLVVLVASSHDYTDNPSFQALDKNTHPTEKPFSALIEGITRYLPRYLPQLGAADKADRLNEKEIEQHALEGLNDLRNFLELAKNNTATKVLVFQHWEKSEIEKGSPNPGNRRIKEICELLSIACVSLEPYFNDSLRNGDNPYRDNIHPNKVGQQLIANAIQENILRSEN